MTPFPQMISPLLLHCLEFSIFYVRFSCILNIWPFLLHIFSVCESLLGIEVTLAEGKASPVFHRRHSHHRAGGDISEKGAQNLMTYLNLPVVMEGCSAALCTILPTPLEITAF